MVAIGAANYGKFLLKVPTSQILPNYMGNYRAEEAIPPREEIVIAMFEFIKMIIGQLPQQ